MAKPKAGNKWPGIPSTSRLWFLTEDFHDAMARRGIWALATSDGERSFGGNDERGRQATCAEYLPSAIQVKEELRQQEKSIAAEAIRKGIPYSVLGTVLSTRRTTQHNKVSKLTNVSSEPSCLTPEWLSGPPTQRLTRGLICTASQLTQVEIPKNHANPPEEWIEILARLKSASMLADSTERAIRETMGEMSTLGSSWRAIGSALGNRSAQAANQRFRQGVPADRKTALPCEKYAVDLLEDVMTDHGRLPPHLVRKFDRTSIAETLFYAVSKFRTVTKETNGHADRLSDRLATGFNPRDAFREDQEWAEKASLDIANAITPLMTPQVFGGMMEFGRLLDEVIQRSGRQGEFSIYLLYLWFLFALSWSYASVRPRKLVEAEENGRKLSDEELYDCQLHVIKGVAVAAKTVDTFERLGLDKMIDGSL
jgi:hypothetical protein